MRRITKIFLLSWVACICLSAMPAPAFAKGIKAVHAIAGDASAEFGDSALVGDKDLEKMRGGFSIGGVNIQFSYNSIATINGNVQSNVSLNSTDLQNAIANGTTLPGVGQPVVIQNVSNNTLITLQQQLNLTVANAGIAQATNAAFHQATLQNALAFK